MDCQIYQKEISGLLDGELDDKSAKRLKEHLAVCPTCSAIHERMKALGDNLKAVQASKPSPALAEKVKAAVARERERAEDRLLVPLRAQLPLAAVLVLLAVGLGNLAGQSMTDLLTADRSEEIIELVTVNGDRSFADLVMDVGSEENSP